MTSPTATMTRELPPHGHLLQQHLQQRSLSGTSDCTSDPRRTATRASLPSPSRDSSSARGIGVPRSPHLELQLRQDNAGLRGALTRVFSVTDIQNTADALKMDFAPFPSISLSAQR
jgi:hypothetical protein